MEHISREADSKEEKRKARALVLMEYVRSGYIAAADGGADAPLGILPSDQAVASSSSVTLVVPNGEDIVGTVSLVFDSPDGFPMDSLYHEELEAIRREGYCLAEVVQLATDQDYANTLPGIGGNLSLLLGLFRGVLRLGEERGVEGFCITVNPKHDSFYAELGFVPIAEARPYKALGGAMALPKILYWQEVLQHMDRRNSLFSLLRDTI